MAPRSSARRRPWTRCSRSPAKRRASRGSSTSPESRRSTTARRCRAPESPTSSSRIGASAAKAKILCRSSPSSIATIPEADILVMPPPPIQGVGNDAGFTMQVELRDGSFDMAKLQSVTNAIVANAKTQSALELVLASFRSSVPQYRLEVDRVKTEALQVPLDQVFAALGGYLGSTCAGTGFEWSAMSYQEKL